MIVRSYSIHNSPLYTLSDLYVGTASPSTYFAHTRNPPSPSHSTNLNSTRRLGQSSSRPVPRSSDVDFDSVPSPRRSQQSRVLRQSNGAGPSNLSKSTVAFDDDEGGEVDGGGGDDGFDDYDPPGNDASPDAHTASQRTPRRTSFSALDQDDEEEEEAITPRQPSSIARKSSHNNSNSSRDLNGTGTGKGKGKARPPSSPSPAVPASDDLPHYQDQDIGVEDDIANGLNDVGSGEDDEEEEPPAKKAKIAKKPRKERKVVQLPDGGTLLSFLLPCQILIQSKTRISAPRRPPQPSPPLSPARMVAPRKSGLWKAREWNVVRTPYQRDH